MRLLLSLVAAAGLLSTAITASADTTTQYLTFTSNFPDATHTGGSGSFTLDGTIDPQGVSELNVTSLDATLDGLRLGAASGYETYVLGQLESFTIFAFASNGPNTFEFLLNPEGTVTSGSVFGYSFYPQYDDPDQSFYDTGLATLSNTPPNAVTPEPSSFALLGPGLLGVAYLRRRLQA